MRMIPRIYESTTTSMDGLGIAPLPDAVTCVVTEERNGEFYCELTYPAFGQNASQIQVGRIISAKPNLYDDPQAFRIQKIEKTLDGTMSITAYHISYDLTNIAISPFAQAAGIQTALTNLTNAAATANTFALDTDIVNTASQYGQLLPNNMRGAMLGQEGSLLDVFGGEWKFNNWECTLMKSRGQERNVLVAYGKNLSSFKETDTEGNYDAIYPYAVIDDVTYYLTDTGVCATAPLVESTTSYGYPRTVLVDLSDNFETAPTQAQLYAAALSWMNSNSPAPTASYSTEFLDLQKLIGVAERVDLCDTIYLTILPYGSINMTWNVIKTIYDVLEDEYVSLEVGDKKVTLADQLAPIL